MASQDSLTPRQGLPNSKVVSTRPFWDAEPLPFLLCLALLRLWAVPQSWLHDGRGEVERSPGPRPHLPWVLRRQLCTPL